MAAYLHVLVSFFSVVCNEESKVKSQLQQKEDDLREEFNNNIDQRIRSRMESQLSLREKEIQSKYDTELVSQRKVSVFYMHQMALLNTLQVIEDAFEAERINRMSRMAEIEISVSKVSSIIEDRDRRLHGSQKVVIASMCSQVKFIAPKLIGSCVNRCSDGSRLRPGLKRAVGELISSFTVSCG
jgi:hypothetical protein